MMSSFRGCFEVDFGLSLGRVLCHVFGLFGVSIGAGLSPIERFVYEMSLGQKTTCTGAPKVPLACNCIGSTLLRRSLFVWCLKLWTAITFSFELRFACPWTL